VRPWGRRRGCRPVPGEEARNAEATATAAKLAKKLGSDPQRLRDEYALVMTFGGRTLADVRVELEEIETAAEQAKLSIGPILASRIARADIQHAKSLLSG